MQLFRALVHQGPKQKRTDTLRHAHLVFTSTIDGDLDPYLDELAEQGARGRRVVGALRRLPGARRSSPRSARSCASARRRAGLFQSAMPRATVTEVREALALREQVIDFAVEAQGLDAAALQERFRASLLMLGRPPNLPRRRGRPSNIDLDDIQGNVLRGYTMPAAAYLWLRIVDVPTRAAPDDADAAVGGDGRAVERRRRRPR